MPQVFAFEQMMDGMKKSKSRGTSDQRETREGKIVGREIREVTKFACQQISSTVQNTSDLRLTAPIPV